MDKEKDNIFKMLKSEDVEMVELGIIAALAQGREWCLRNIPEYSMRRGRISIQLYGEALKKVCTRLYIKGDLGITSVYGNFLVCKPLTKYTEWEIKTRQIVKID
jgi:hypothetical protein